MKTQLELFLENSGMHLTLEDLHTNGLKKANIIEVLQEEINEASQNLYSMETLEVLDYVLPNLLRFYRAKAELQDLKTFVGLPDHEPGQYSPPDVYNTVEGVLQDYGTWVGVTLAANDGESDVTPEMYLSEMSAFTTPPPRELAELFLSGFYGQDQADRIQKALAQVYDTGASLEVVELYVMYAAAMNAGDFNWMWLSGKQMLPVGSGIVILSKTLSQYEMREIWDRLREVNGPTLDWEGELTMSVALGDGRSVTLHLA